MSFYNDGLNFSHDASADLRNDQYKGVTLDATGVLIAGADANIVGVLQNDPEEAGQSSNIRTKGVTKAVAGGSVTVGDRVGTDADGAFVTGATVSVATAIESASGAGSIFAITLD